MDLEQCVNEIAENYMHIMEFQRSGKYSREQTTVFTAPDQAHWLSIEQMDNHIIQARLSDENGVVTAWDNYNVCGGRITLCEAVRRSENGQEKISFTADELKEISRIADGQREGRDGAVYSAAGKMCRLSEESCAELCATAGRVYGVSSLSARLERAGRRAEKRNTPEREQIREGQEQGGHRRAATDGHNLSR